MKYKIKKIKCSKCNKELINISLPTENKNQFWCDDCNLNWDIEITERGIEIDEY